MTHDPCNLRAVNVEPHSTPTVVLGAEEICFSHNDASVRYFAYYMGNNFV
jgi:hypothetical protein